MRKIISLFQRNYDGDRLVRNEVVPGAEWVLSGEGVPTRKFDGTCCLVRGGKLYKRYEVAKGKQPPPNFEPATEVDENTGKQQGWVPVGDGPEDRWHREAWENAVLNAGNPPHEDGTYELVGPKVQGNPEGYPRHFLVRHGFHVLPDAPRPEWHEGEQKVTGFFDEVREYLRTHDIEGIVWWRDLNDPDCEKAKIKAKDFGLKRPKPQAARTP